MPRRSRRNDDSDFGDFEGPIEGIVILALGGYVWLWFTNRTRFWMYSMYLFIGIVLSISVIFFFKHLKYKLKEKRLNVLLESLKENKEADILVKNFIDRFGHEKVTSKNKNFLFIYRDYAFDWKRIHEFCEELSQKGVHGSVPDFCRALHRLIDEKEQIFMRERVSTMVSHSFTELQNRGSDFEQLIFRLSEAMGYASKHTGKTGDQGADIIASKGGEQVVIQAKCYSMPVGNKAIQEAVAALKLYGCNKATVITTSSFTPEAVALAHANSVELVDRKRLQEFLSSYLHESWQ